MYRSSSLKPSKANKNMPKQYVMTALICLSVIFFTAHAYAAECKYGDLMLEYTPVQTFAAEPFFTAQLSGTVDLPNPNYTYKLSISTEQTEQAGGALEFFLKDPDAMSPQVITPVTINDTIKIPHSSKSLMIDVIKPFNWGAEYYRAEFNPEFFTDNSKPICMKADVYK